ncbi:MAG: hypothetical protein ABW019_05335 [Chitinophagaceae bacterium]
MELNIPAQPNKKQKAALFIPLVIIATMVIRTWVVLLSAGYISSWRHYTAPLLFIPVVYLAFTNYPKALIGTGIYLLLASSNLLSLTAEISSLMDITIAGINIPTPPLQLSALGVLLLFLVLNWGTLDEMYLDYKEAREKKNN